MNDIPDGNSPEHWNQFCAREEERAEDDEREPMSDYGLMLWGAMVEGARMERD